MFLQSERHVLFRTLNNRLNSRKHTQADMKTNEGISCCNTTVIRTLRRETYHHKQMHVFTDRLLPIPLSSKAWHLKSGMTPSSKSVITFRIRFPRLCDSHHCFPQFATIATIDAKEEDAQQALKSAFDANVFYHDPVKMVRLRLHMIGECQLLPL